MGNVNVRPAGVLIVGELPLARRGLRLLLESSHDFVVIDDVGDPELVPAVVREHAPRVVLLELPWSDPVGSRVVESVAAFVPPGSLVVLAPANEPMPAPGVAACLTKRSQPGEFLGRLRELAAHRPVRPLACSVPPSTGSPAVQPAPTRRPLILRDWELELVRMVAEGLRSKEIAELIRLGCKSVETRRARLMRKLGCRNTVDLVRYAIREGIVPA